MNSAELVVKVYNIKYNKGAEILKKNQNLYGYSILLSYVELYRAGGYSSEDAAKMAVERCMEEDILYEFLQIYGSEVRGMLFDYVSKEEFAEIRAEERGDERYAEGKIIGRAEGKSEAITELAKRMLADDMPIDQIEKYTGLTEAEIEDIKKQVQVWSPEQSGGF